MNHIQITIQASDPEQEILIGILSQYAAAGFEQNDKSLIAYFDEDHFNSYEINDAIKSYKFQIETLKSQNWNAVWESNFQPVLVDNFCGIRADFHEAIKNVAHEIVITPKMSFGTGHHATTYMMVAQMQAIDFKNKTVFDFGTGTGILAILAEQLGAAGIFAIDNDSWSIENAKENADRNNCTKIELQLTENIPSQKFDIILANINRNVILEHAAALKNATLKNSLVLLSGLLVADETDVVACFEQSGFVFVSKMVRGNWISLLFNVSG
jgi:ribosomal protein L11 methyltransferase